MRVNVLPVSHPKDLEKRSSPFSLLGLCSSLALPQHQVRIPELNLTFLPYPPVSPPETRLGLQHGSQSYQLPEAQKGWSSCLLIPSSLSHPVSSALHFPILKGSSTWRRTWRLRFFSSILTVMLAHYHPYSSVSPFHKRNEVTARPGFIPGGKGMELNELAAAMHSTLPKIMARG